VEPVASLAACAEDQIRSLAGTLVRTLKALYEATQIDCLTVVCHQVPETSNELSMSYRLHFEICPFKHWAGAERGLGEFAIEIVPERTALELMNQLR
jgi:galactose-1-phosphate uridylyltransferase